MAEKETNSKTTPAKSTVKVTAKPTTTATAKSASAAKPAAAAKPATNTTAKTAATTAPKTTSTAKPATTATAKPTTTAKPASAAKPATTAKPAVPATATKPAASAAPKAAATKPTPVVSEVAAAEVKPEKTKKEKPAKAAKTGGGGSAAKAKVAAIVKTDNFKIFGIIGLSLILVLCLSLGLVFGLQSCMGMEGILKRDPITVNAYAQTTKVGYDSKTVGTVQRYKPVAGVQDEQDAFPLPAGAKPAKRYPTYGSTPSGYTGDANAEVRQAIVSESAYLCAWGTAGANRGGEQTADKYTKIDKDGWLYQKKDGQWIHSLKWGTTEQVESNYRQLYKHSASVGLYLGNVSDDEPGIVRQVNLRPRGYSSYSVTGVYAPAGEVIKIQLSGADMNATGGISVHIGQALYNGQANNIWVGKNTMPRMAHILTTLAINKETAEYDEATDTWTGYVGSFLGGPIYIRNTSVEVTATISGACAYRHFILGYTTEEEFNELSKSTVPYFDLEVWEYGVLHSGPVRYAKAFSYEDLYKAAVLWEKVSTVTTTNGTKQGIVFLYDPFVAAGAAVAFPGRSSVNCPLGWMSQSLNYNSIVTSGSWGNFHEYHHNFQNYGVSSGANGEVTNNGLNLVSYSLFTNISSSRQVAGYGGSGLSGWNRYTSATWALNQVNKGSITSTNGLAIYATLLHNYGQDAYIKARGSSNTNGYLDKWATNTHQDFTYFASQITKYGTGAYTPSQPVKDANYPLFVPVSSVYQTGRTYMYDGEKREINTMQPYVIPYGKSFTVDLNPYEENLDNNGNFNGQYKCGSVVIGNGFTYRIKSVNTDGVKGTFVKSGDGEGIYTFTPDTNELRSGKIYVTLEIFYGSVEGGVREWNGHKLDDVDLVLEFQQSHESSKHVLERTIYTYDAANMISDATEAFNNNFGTYKSTTTIDHSNPTQNANTDIWYWPSTSGHEAYAETHPEYFATNNEIAVIDGKLYFTEDGRFRIYLRGRLNCAVYFSLDGKDYKLGATIKDKTAPANSAAFRLKDANTYFDIEFNENVVTVITHLNGNDVSTVLSSTFSGNRWLYTKEVLIVQSSPSVSYIGLGMAQWTVPQYTTEVKYYTIIDGKQQTLTVDNDTGACYYTTSDKVKHFVDTDGTRYYFNSDGEKVDEGKVGAVQTETIYKNGSGKVVTAEEANDTALREPTSANYVTAYRRTYDFKKQFESDYFYTRSYAYNYTDNITVPKSEVTVTQTNYTATGWGKGMPITNISDGKTGTYIHTSWEVTEAKPLNLTFDLGGERKINRISFYCRNNNGMLETPKAFTVEGSLDGETWFDVAAYTEAPRNGNYVTVDFDEVTLNYCRISISKTHQGNGKYYVVIGEIAFTHATEILGGKQYSPDDKMFTYKGNWTTESCHANFGHVYIGKAGTMEFEFEGNRLAIIASKYFGRNYEVYVDGKLVESDYYKTDDGDYSVSFLSPELESGKHKVVVYCKGEGNIDSVIVW